MSDFNCYVSVIADDVFIARGGVLAEFNAEPVQLIHVSHPEDPDEGNTYVFSFLADVVNEDGDQDLLHDHFDLPNHPNLPYEAA